MKILSASQIQEADQYTIQNEPITSIDLMERASERFVEWFVAYFDVSNSVKVFCGTGNNGGDGLAISRLLKDKGYNLAVYVVRVSDKDSGDFTINSQRLDRRVSVDQITSEDDFPKIETNDVIIDGLFGSGLTRPVEGLYESIINLINQHDATTVAIDLPSGMFCDQPIAEAAVIKADYTVSFQCPKLAFFLPDNLENVGQWHLVDIGLDALYIDKAKSFHFAISHEWVSQHIKLKKVNDHKGSNGRALLIAGSYGKMGAAVLAAKAAMRSGLGLLTVHSPHCGYSILQTAVPEVMVSPDPTEFYFGEQPETEKIDAIGIGPGLDKKSKTVKAMGEFLKQWDKPMVIDADALNILSENRHFLELLPANSILTPHHGEFERLVGTWDNDLKRIELQQDFSKKYHVITLFKGPASTITTPEGVVYFNTSGNAGMATAGSGDVLTGIITSLLAQGYKPIQAATIACYIHGLAGDLAAGARGIQSMIASDIIEYISDAYLNLLEG